MNSERAINVLFSFTDVRGMVNEEWIAFPATAEDMGELFKRAGTFNTNNTHMTPVIFENGDSSPVGNITELPIIEETVNELNYLAAKLSELDGDELDKFEAVIESGRHLGEAGVGIGEIADYINIADNLDSFTFHADMDASGYGEHLLSGPENKVDAMIRMLRYYYGQEGEEFANYVECLRECADAEQFGQSMFYNNDGEFLDSGYLIEEGGFYENYRDVADIPAEYRIWEDQRGALIKVTDVELTTLLLEMHALGGNYTQDAAANLAVLYGGGEYFITENKGKLTVLSAKEVFCKDSPENAAFLVDYEQDARAYYALAYNFDGSKLLNSSIYEIDINEMKNDVARLSYGAVSVDVEFKDGTNRTFTPEEWNGLSGAERDYAADMVCRYDPNAESTADKFLENLMENVVQPYREITQEEFLASINAPFMSRAKNAQPNMLRVAREAASTMLARSDAEVYRLTPEGASRLAPLDAVKSRGLWFTEHREFAIKLDSLEGLDKWAQRTAEDIARQATRDVREKSHGQEL